ncbi:HAD family hydrolase [Nocardia niigatensis]
MLPDTLHAICFDIGGVLVPMPKGPLAEEISAILDVDVEDVRDLLIKHGKTIRTTASKMGRIITDNWDITDEMLHHQIERALRQRFPAEPPLYPDTIPTLDALTESGWRICYLSNAVGLPPEQQPSFYKWAEQVVSSWEIGHCKPDIAAFRVVEQRMALAPQQLVMVGDSLRFDIAGALAAGWSAVHLDRDRAVKQPEVPTISSLPELIALLPSLGRNA